MAFTPITGTVPQYSTANNELASGYYLKFYEAGTTTPLSIATDGTGGTLLAKVKLNARGLPITNPLDDDTVFIPHVDQAYRIVLYKSEADADANNTSNAEFNIASVAPDVAPSADAADITLRTNNLEAWDDYDRSPLFVDGTDFTAGAGPHVITVPADWDPTDADFRIWKLDAPADTVIALTATTETSTTFTLAETLLSTDVIFIGDDQFRNIHDGDPTDIRTRLDIPTNAETLLVANNLQEIEDAGPSAQTEARGNLGVEADTETVVLSTGLASPSNLYCHELRGRVTLTVEAITTSVSDTSFSINAAVPARFRPNIALGSTNYGGGGAIYRTSFNTNGDLVWSLEDTTTGAAVSTTSYLQTTITFYIP